MEKEKKIGAIAVVTIVILVVVLAYITNFTPSQNLEETTGYTTIGVEEAYELINKSERKEINLTVVDCRGLEGCSKCQFKNGHLPKAIMETNPENLYNSSNDILVYSVNGTVGEEFCKKLVGNVKGRIYNLEGGWDAWEEHNLTYGWPPIDKGEQ